MPGRTIDDDDDDPCIHSFIVLFNSSKNPQKPKHAPEADAAALGLHLLLPLPLPPRAQHQHQRVEIGCFGRPLAGRLDGEGERHFLLLLLGVRGRGGGAHDGGLGD